VAGNGTCDDVEVLCGFHINRSDGGAAIATLLRPLASPSCIDLNPEITALH
jgi:hypothetical protein